MIDLTPLEVRKKKGDFRRAMRGYDPALVDDFIDLVADRLEQLVRDHFALTERVGRQEQQIAEYRERERALTEALVTAQEMREEMRKQSAREAELAKRTAEQESAEMRATTQQEVQQLRASAQQEAQQLRSSAERAAAELRASAEQAATELRANAERAATELRGNAMREREREEEAVRRLRARQEQFFSTYRAFLERELAEVGVITQTLGVAVGAVSGAAPPPPATAEPTPAFAAVPPVPPVAPPSPEPAFAMTPPPARGDTLVAGSSFTLTAPQDEEGAQATSRIDFAAPAVATGPDAGLVSFLPPPAEQPPFHTSFETPSLRPSAFDPPEFVHAEPAAVVEEGPEPPSFEVSYEPPARAGTGALEESAFVQPFEAEPFEPEPFEPEDADEDDPHEEELPLLMYDAEPEDEVVADESLLYDGIAAPEDDGVPGPIGLAPPRLAWGEDLGEEEDEEDEETSRLLRNAAAAGYRLPDDDELLLDETVEEETEPKKGSGWLPNLLEDES